MSLRAIAKASGFSKSTVGYVLGNSAGPSEDTRERILLIAKKLGYVPNSRLNAWMAMVRSAPANELVPIAWLNTDAEKDAWQKYKWLSPYRDGVKERCEQLGYRLDEVWTRQPGMTMRRLNKILFHRGIQGVLITPPATHLQLDWSNLAGVVLETAMLAPRLHRVRSDVTYNLLLALKILKRFGYRRIGICLCDYIDRNLNRVISAIANDLASKAPESKVFPPLFYKTEVGGIPALKKQIMSWVRFYKLDVIVGQSNDLVEWIEEWGYRVPQQIGFVQLAVDDDVLDWAGIHSNKKVIGRAATDLLVSLLNHRQFGPPEAASETTIRGSWHHGRTLLIPKSK